MSGLSVLSFVFAGSGWLNTMVAPTDAVASAWPGSTMTGAGSPGRGGWCFRGRRRAARRLRGLLRRAARQHSQSQPRDHCEACSAAGRESADVHGGRLPGSEAGTGPASESSARPQRHASPGRRSLCGILAHDLHLPDSSHVAAADDGRVVCSEEQVEIDVQHLSTRRRVSVSPRAAVPTAISTGLAVWGERLPAPAGTCQDRASWSWLPGLASPSLVRRRWWRCGERGRRKPRRGVQRKTPRQRGSTPLG